MVIFFNIISSVTNISTQFLQSLSIASLLWNSHIKLMNWISKNKETHATFNSLFHYSSGSWMRWKIPCEYLRFGGI